MRTIKDTAFNYDRFGQTYSGHRQTDPYIAACVHEALGEAKTILNLGAGAGSYEPDNRYVIALEPSEVMRAQRMAQGKVPALIGKAGALPFDDQAFDASMAMITVHHWPDIAKGLLEMRRVTKHQVVIMTFDPDALTEFWNVHYFPELIEVERSRYPKIADITNALGGTCEVKSVAVPLDCIDGFQEAFYGRPEAFLDKQVRMSQSAWGFLKAGEEERMVQALADELESGAWNKKYGHLRTQKSFTGALRLIIARP